MIDWNKPLRAKNNPDHIVKDFSLEEENLVMREVNFTNGRILYYRVNGEAPGAEDYALENYELEETEMCGNDREKQDVIIAAPNLTPCCGSYYTPEVIYGTTESTGNALCNNCRKIVEHPKYIKEKQMQEKQPRPFDYEAFKAGEKIYDPQDEDTGEFLREINSDIGGNIVVLWTDEDGDQSIYAHTLESCKVHYTMAPKKITGWINIYPSSSKKISYHLSGIFLTKEIAQKEAEKMYLPECIKTIPIEFEV